MTLLRNHVDRFCPHQSLCHGGLIFSGEVLLQGQYDTVGGDGGQDHVLKWCKGSKVKDSTFMATRAQKTDTLKQTGNKLQK